MWQSGYEDGEEDREGANGVSEDREDEDYSPTMDLLQLVKREFSMSDRIYVLDDPVIEGRLRRFCSILGIILETAKKREP